MQKNPIASQSSTENLHVQLKDLSLSQKIRITQFKKKTPNKNRKENTEKNHRFQHKHILKTHKDCTF